MDEPTVALVRLAAAIARGGVEELARAIEDARAAEVPHRWVDELLLQSVLMVGWPRALVAAGRWRDGGPRAPRDDTDAEQGRVEEWLRRGEETCRSVYGTNYDRLRENVRQLHPALDLWMITEGYGRTLARAGLDLRRRELCTVAQTAVLDAPHQLHSHLRGALNVGATPAEVEEALALATSGMPARRRGKLMAFWKAILARHEAGVGGESRGGHGVR
jgi:4-carboxymuconolactone decarboxylase